ncbi:hypothetical protein MHYP_G00109600 [Metynnis hypsauchen]
MKNDGNKWVQRNAQSETADVISHYPKQSERLWLNYTQPMQYVLALQARKEPSQTLLTENNTATISKAKAAQLTLLRKNVRSQANSSLEDGATHHLHLELCEPLPTVIFASTMLCNLWQTKLSASCCLDSRIRCVWEHNPEQLVREAREQTVCVWILAEKASMLSLTRFGYTNNLTAVEKSYKCQMEHIFPI